MTKYTKKPVEVVQLKNCPDCNSELMTYHESIKDGGRSSKICKQKCKGWKVLQIRERWGDWETPKPDIFKQTYREVEE